MYTKNKKIKKALSMIELLFVMLILAALTAIAIPSMSENEKSVKQIALMTDLKEANKMVVQEFMNNQTFSGAVGVYVDSDNNGLADTNMNGTPFHISQGNTITITLESCATSGTGYKIVGNLGAVTKEYNSCTSAKIH